MHSHASHAASAHTGPSAASPILAPLVSSVHGERSAAEVMTAKLMSASSVAAEIVAAEIVTGKSPVTEFLTTKAVTTEFLVTAHRVPRETPASTVMAATSAVATVTGPTTLARFMPPVSACPTVVTMPAVMAVTGEFEAASAAKMLAAAAPV